MRKILLAAFAAFLFAQNLPAQILKTTDVLATAASDTRLAQNRALENTAQGLKMHDPFLRQIAVRLGINGSALGDTIYGYLRNEDTYQLQFGFNSLHERRRQRQVKTARVAAIAAEGRLLAHEALADRYEALAGYFFVEPKLAACRRLDTLLEKEHRILREMLSTGALDVKVSKVLDAEEDRNRNRLAMQELENTRTLHRNRLRQFVGDFSELDRSDLATLADLQANIATLKTAPLAAAGHPLLDLKNAETQLENANLNYVAAQNRQLFNNFNVGYQRPLFLERPKNFNTFNNFYLRVGLTVPLPANNRFKKADALLDLREAQNEAAWEQENTQTELENQFVLLENLFREHALAQDRLDNSLIRKMLDNPTLLAQITPLEIVELEIAQQKLAISQAGLLLDIAVEYVELLKIAGAMGHDAAVNYLGKKQ
ncbi:MAG: hypothetical protein ACK4Q5_04045 [Saprospiraceae bacterium]